MKKIVFLLYILILVICCKDHNEGNANIYTITADIDQENRISLFDIAAKVRLIPLETNDESLIAHITKIIIDRNKIYIYDRTQNEIFLFDKNGKFLSKINQKGRGPNEYMAITDLRINPFSKQLEVLDPWGKLLTFNLNGIYMKTLKLPKEIHAYDEFIPINNDSIAFYSLSEPYTLNIYSRSSSKIVHQSFESKKKLTINSPLSSFYRFQDTVYFTRYLYDDVYSITKHGVNPAYQWLFPKYKYDPDEVIPEYDRNNRKDYFSIQELLPYTHINTLENDLYRYTCISIQSGKKYINIFHNKKTNKNTVFNKTKEGIIFTPYILNDTLALGPIEPWRKREEYLNEQILDNENLEILNNLSENDNPILIEYTLKK